jgi:hypothetical protein
MRQYFIKQGTSESLLLVFAGWAFDESFFSGWIKPNTDICICSDYRSLEWDKELFFPYRDIRVIAWSLGVFVAGNLLPLSGLPLSEVIALNGTLFPVDDERGIPEAIYNGTEENLTEENLLKFYRRMCSGTKDYKEFLKNDISFSIEELREALRNIKSVASKCLPDESALFTKVVIGMRDRIFPAENQKKAWEKHPRVVWEDIEHYDENYFNRLLSTL